jgi:uncharacterized protein (TIGR02186 family)
MMMRAFLLLFVMALPAQAEEVVAGMSQNRVSITANFDGSEILIFGAVKREAPPPNAGPLQVVITVAGPSEPVMVRRKEKRFGIWVNTDSVEVDAAPSFYKVVSTTAFSDALSAVEDLRHHVSIPRAIRSVGAPMNVVDAASFSDALIRIRENAGLYVVSENSVRLVDETLFDAQIALPANLTEGDYKTRIFLTRDGTVVDLYETSIDVRKVGLERFLFSLAHEKPLIYGLLSLAIAIAAGWSASAVFAYLRG